MVIKNSVYDKLKWLCMFFLPALAVFVKTVFSIWDFPYANEISATIVAVNALLSACLGISSISYQKGQLEKKENWDQL